MSDVADGPARGLAMSTLDYFLSLGFGRVHPDFRRTYDLVEAGPHKQVAEALQQFGAVESISSASIDSAAVFVVDSEHQDFTVYLSCLFPYAAVIRKAESGEVAFLDPSSNEEVVAIVVDAGFLVLPETVCRTSSQFQDPVSGDVMTVFEVLFEHEVDPPWEWPDQEQEDDELT